MSEKNSYELEKKKWVIFYIEWFISFTINELEIKKIEPFYDAYMYIT